MNKTKFLNIAVTILTAGKKAIWETDFKYTSFVNFIPKCFIFDSVKTGIIKKKTGIILISFLTIHF